MNCRTLKSCLERDGRSQLRQTLGSQHPQRVSLRRKAMPARKNSGQSPRGASLLSAMPVPGQSVSTAGSDTRPGAIGMHRGCRLGTRGSQALAGQPGVAHLQRPQQLLRGPPPMSPGRHRPDPQSRHCRPSTPAGR